MSIIAQLKKENMLATHIPIYMKRIWSHWKLIHLHQDFLSQSEFADVILHGKWGVVPSVIITTSWVCNANGLTLDGDEFL